MRKYHDMRVPPSSGIAFVVALVAPLLCGGCKGGAKVKIGSASGSASAAPGTSSAEAAGTGKAPAAAAAAAGSSGRLAMLADLRDRVRLDAKIVAQTEIYTHVCGGKARFPSYETAMVAAKKTRDDGRALVAYRAALSLRSGDLEALLGVMKSAHRSGDQRGAWRAARRVIATKSISPSRAALAWRIKGDVELSFGKLVAAEKSYARAAQHQRALAAAAAAGAGAKSAAAELARIERSHARARRAIAAWTRELPRDAPQRGPTIGLPLPWAKTSSVTGSKPHGCQKLTFNKLCACLKKEADAIQPKSCGMRKTPIADGGALRVVRIFGKGGFGDAVVEQSADKRYSALLHATVSTDDAGGDEPTPAIGGVKVLRVHDVADRRVVWVEHNHVVPSGRARHLEICHRRRTSSDPYRCGLDAQVIDFTMSGGRGVDGSGGAGCAAARVTLFDDGTVSRSQLYGGGSQQVYLLLPAARQRRARPARASTPSPTPAPATASSVPPPFKAAVVDLAQFKRAFALNWEGLRSLKRKKHGAAVARFIDALRVDPGHVYARYNLASAYALMGRAADAMKMLRQLDRADCPMCRRRLRAAAKDSDLAALRADPAFAKLTATVVAEPDYHAAAKALMKSLHEGKADVLMETVKHYRVLRYDFRNDKSDNNGSKGVAWRAKDISALLKQGTGWQPAKSIRCKKGSTCCDVTTGHDGALSGPASHVLMVSRICFWAQSSKLALPIRLRGGWGQPEG